jgi:hypothetical protein
LFFLKRENDKVLTNRRGRSVRCCCTRTNRCQERNVYWKKGP